MNKGIYLKTADIYLRFPEIMEEECNDLAEFLEDEHIVYEGATDIVYNLQQENQRLKEIEKEHQKINGSLHLEIKELKDIIDKAVEIIEKEIECLKDKKRMIMQVLTPENGYLKADVEYEIKRLEKYLEILKGDKK